MSGLDVEDIQVAYREITDRRKEGDDHSQKIDWMILSYASKIGNKLVLSGKGTGGLSEMVKTFDDSKAQYGYVRVTYRNDSQSERTKFAFVVWIGNNMSGLQKGRVTFDMGNVKGKFFHHIAVETTGDRSILSMDEMLVRMRRAGGADYNGGRG